MNRLRGGLVASFCLFLSGMGLAQSLTIIATPSLKEVAHGAAKRFGAAKVVVVSADQILERSRTGDADVVLASGSDPFRSETKLALTSKTFGRNRLVIVTSQDDPVVEQMSDLAKEHRLGLAPVGTPLGEASQQLFALSSRAYGKGWLGLVERRVSERHPDPSVLIERVASGELDAAVVFASDVHVKPAGIRVTSIPAGLSPALGHVAIVLRASKHRAKGIQFVESLFTATAQAELVHKGFISPLAPVDELPVIYNGAATRLFVKSLPSLAKSTVTVSRKKMEGASLVDLLKRARGNRVRLTGADGLTVDIPLTELRRNGGLLVPMGDGNVRAVLPGHSEGKWVRWLRSIEVL